MIAVIANSIIIIWRRDRNFNLIERVLARFAAAPPRLLTTGRVNSQGGGGLASWTVLTGLERYNMCGSEPLHTPQGFWCTE